MNTEEIKAQLIEAGATEEDITKVDFATIENLIDNATSIEGLCKALKRAYPDFNEAEFKKVVAEYSKDSEEAQDLSEDDLEAVAGGSVGSWLKENKNWLIPVASGLAVLGIAGRFIYKYRQRKAYDKALEDFNNQKLITPGMMKKFDKKMGDRPGLFF